jgi:hypothetical protein
LSVTTAIVSSTAASRSEATTLIGSTIGTGSSGTASGFGSTVQVTPTTIAGGYADRPSLRGARIGGAAITTASAITNTPPHLSPEAVGRLGAFLGTLRPTDRHQVFLAHPGRLPLDSRETG